MEKVKKNPIFFPDENSEEDELSSQQALENDMHTTRVYTNIYCRRKLKNTQQTKAHIIKILFKPFCSLHDRIDKTD